MGADCSPGTGPAACTSGSALWHPKFPTCPISRAPAWQCGHCPSTSRSMLWLGSLPGFSRDQLPSPECSQGLPPAFTSDVGSRNSFGFQFKIKISVTVKTLLFPSHAGSMLPWLPTAHLPAGGVIFQRLSCSGLIWMCLYENWYPKALAPAGWAQPAGLVLQRWHL